MRLYRDEIRALLTGASFFGAGGGGSVGEGLALLESLKVISIAPLSAFPDDGLLASPYACGSLTSESSGPGSPKELKATLALQRYLGKRFDGLFPTELGGYNTAVALFVAGELGIPVVDGDAAGRAVPAIHHSLFYLSGVPAWPLAVASSSDEIIIVEEARDDREVEKLVRFMVERWGNVGVCDHPVKKQIAAECLVKGSLSRALAMGACIERRDLEGLLKVSGARIVHEGEIERVTWEEREGLTIGRIDIRGGITIEFKNENYRLKGPNIQIGVPDIITLIDEELRPLSNPPKAGIRVRVLVAKADPRWYGHPDLWD